MPKPAKQPVFADKPLRYLQELFDRAGSSTKLAAELNLHAFTVENWRKSGIPLKYWEQLRKLYGISAEELYRISRHCRESSREKQAASKAGKNGGR